MTPRTSQLFAGYNALLLVAQTALPTLVGVGAVYDGPQPEFLTSQDAVFVGCDDPVSSSEVLAVDSGNQDWVSDGPGVGADKRESFTIYCSYVAWTGDNDLPGCRSRAASNIALIETALRSNPTGGPTASDGLLGTNAVPGPLAPTGGSSISVVRLKMIQTNSGPALHVLFQVNCWTYI